MAKGKDVLKEILTPNQYSLIFESSSDVQERYSEKILSKEQKELLPNLEDRVRYALVEDIAKNSPAQLNTFDKYGTRNSSRYLKICRLWLELENFFLGERIHHQPDSEDLAGDFEEKQLCQKRRAFYLLRYPAEVEKLKDIPSLDVSALIRNAA